MSPQRAPAAAALALALLAVAGCTAQAAAPPPADVVASADRITTLAEAAAYADALSASDPDALAEISRTAGVVADLVGERLAYPVSLPMKARLVVIQANARDASADAAQLLAELRDIATRAASGENAADSSSTQ